MLSANLCYFAENSMCKGVAVSPSSPSISHLLFADDNFFFLNFDMVEIWCLRWLINLYCEFTGQKINHNKSEIFVSPNMLPWQRDFLTEVLGIKIVGKPGVYLGSRIDVSRRKGDLIGRILERMQSRLGKLNMHSLDLGGRLILVKHTLSTIPIYLLSVFRAPSYFVDKVRSLIVQFLWGKRDGRGFCWKKWEDLCKPLS